MKDYSFGNYICALRRGLGLSQFQLGALVGVSDKAVSKWENGDAKPKFATCFRLADVLGVPIDELLSCKEHTLTMARKDMIKMNQALWKMAYARLSIFGEAPPATCWSRLAAEEAAFSKTDAIQSFYILGKIEEAAQQYNELFFADGAISSSFAAWLLGATKVNPLPPHYRCPKCCKTIFDSSVADGFDLPVKRCSCGELFIRDGHNIPFEDMAKAEQRGTHVELRTSERFEPVATEIIKEFYLGKAELIPVKLTSNGQSISMRRYIVLKESKAKPLLADDGAWHVDAAEHWHWLDDETTFTLYLNNQIDRISKMQVLTNDRCPEPIQLINSEMIERLLERYKERHSFIRRSLKEDERHDFDFLLRLEGFVHASGAWSEKGFREYDNGSIIYSEGKAKFREIPAFREDLWNDISTALSKHGIRDNGLALQVVSDVGRHGRYYKNGMPKSVEALMAEIDLPGWYPDYLKKVMYLFPKGHCIAMLLTDAIYEWYSSNYPELTGTVLENGGTEDG